MNDLLVVHVFESESHLVEVALGLDFSQPLASFDEFVEGLVGTHLQQNINALRVFEAVLKSDDVLKIQGLVDLDFGSELRNSLRYFFFRFGSVEGCLLDDLGCVHLLGVERRNFVALGKTTLHQRGFTFPRSLPLE